MKKKKLKQIHTSAHLVWYRFKIREGIKGIKPDIAGASLSHCPFSGNVVHLQTVVTTNHIKLSVTSRNKRA